MNTTQDIFFANAVEDGKRYPEFHPNLTDEIYVYSEFEFDVLQPIGAAMISLPDGHYQGQTVKIENRGERQSGLYYLQYGIFIYPNNPAQTIIDGFDPLQYFPGSGMRLCRGGAVTLKWLGHNWVIVEAVMRDAQTDYNELLVESTPWIPNVPA